MKKIEIDDELYAYIASQTRHIGESASQILRRLLIDEPGIVTTVVTLSAPQEVTSEPTEIVETPVSEPAVSSEKAEPAIPATPVGDLLSQVSKSHLAQFDKRVDQFLYILQQIFLQQPEQFAKVETIVGKNRKYFAKSKEALLKSGSSTNPKAIPDSGYWVVTNNNTAKKLAMLSQVLQILGYEDKVVKTVTETFDA